MFMYVSSDLVFCEVAPILLFIDSVSLTSYLTPLNPLSACLSVRPPDSPLGPKGPFSPPQELERSPP